MKKRFTFVFSCLCLMTACACDETGTEQQEPTAPKLIASSPADGATEVATGTNAVELTYDQAVNYNSLCPITINGVPIGDNWSKESNEVLKVGKMKLSRDETVTIVIPQGAVRAASGAEADAATITFSTETTKPIVLADKLVTPNASEQAQKVFAFLKENYQKKYLTAAMANVSWNFAEAELVKAATGKYPAMAVMDYIHLFGSPSGWIDYTDLSAVEQWWQNGGLLAASWHWMVPASQTNNNMSYAPGNGSVNSEGNVTTVFRAKNIFVDGSWEKQIADADLAKMADYLLLLQAKNIPLIWRPLHEAAGNTYVFNGGKAWFWWGYDGAEVYVRLWRYMFDYFKQRGINNLIWVWTSQSSKKSDHDDAFYPGDDYVDIIGCDIYNRQTADIKKQHDEMKSLWPNKILALSECGNVSKMGEQWQNGALWSYAMPWYQYNASTLDAHMHANTAWWVDAMGNPNAVCREDMPNLK